MEIDEAQREVRSAFMGGFVGQFVSAGLWALSAALGTWVSVRSGIIILVINKMLIVPVTQLLLHAMGRRASRSPGDSIQVAFTIPLNLPLVAAATVYRLDWFYPGCMIVVGAHYLPFWFLYGMWQCGLLAGLLAGAGLATGPYLPGDFSIGGWLAAAILVVFAVMREEARPAV